MIYIHCNTLGETLGRIEVFETKYYSGQIRLKRFGLKCLINALGQYISHNKIIAGFCWPEYN